MERLLDYFTPEHYNLSLKIDRTRDLIEGTVKIRGLAHAETIKLHSVGLKIISVNSDNKPLDFKHSEGVIEVKAMASEAGSSAAPATNGERTEQGAPATAGGDAVSAESQPRSTSLELEISYRTTLNKNMQGCYLSTYNFNGAEQRLVATQFESHYAREAFPCIDEPAAKATFNLTIILPDYNPSRDVVLANTPVIGQANDKFDFAPTPRMSTYLLAWVAGPLKSVSTMNQHGVKVSSYCALNQSTESLLFANNTAAKALDFYDEKFGVKYPLPKLDQVALPDFEAGAMENWGLVTYRESCLLADESASLEAKQSVAITVTHELSHQWFGDLVTMAWWDDLWLNESFATMMEFVATDALYPEFNIWQDFFTSDCLAALKRDSLPGVQSVQQAVHDPVEIATLFDSAIVYAKGARLMLMLYRLMGDNAFMKGLRDYFEKYQYGNTVGDDLWNSLQPYADFKVKDFMHAWISQPGYPAVTIPKKSQHRFLINGQTDDTSWPLPEVKDDMSGHYLIRLSDQQFTDKLNHFETLTLEQKLRLLIDRMLLAKTPDVPSASLLDLLPQFVDETAAPVWDILTCVIGDLKLFCPPDTAPAGHYKRYLSHLYKSRFDTIDFGPLTDENAIHVRDALLNIAYYVQDENILDKLAKMYPIAPEATPVADLNKLDPELRSHILAAKLHTDETAIFPIFLEKYQTETDPELKSDLLFTLAGLSEQPEHLDQLISLLDQPDIVRPQDHIFLYIYLLRNHRTRARVLDWLTTHWDYIKQLTGDKSIEDYPRYASALIRTPDEAAVFYNFFDPLQGDLILKRTLKMARTDIDCRLQTIATDSPAVHEKLKTLTERSTK